MKLEFKLPETPTCKVIYERDGTKYSATIPTPSNADGVVSVMLARQVGVSQIRGIEPIHPLQPLRRGHPADHQMVKYATPADH